MKIEAILDTMHELYKDFPLTELNYETPFQCLIAVMMSAQTTDIQVNKVTDTLFKKIKSPSDILKMWKDELWERIRTVGLWTSKRDNIIATSEILVEKSLKTNKQKKVTSVDIWSSIHEKLICKDSNEVVQERWYYIPDTLESMMELPWVGLKTAKVVLYVLFRQKRVAVDTHVHRVMNRLAVINTTSPDISSKQLEKIIPDEYKQKAHHSIIYFGRYLCKAKKPECERCPLSKHCKWYKENRI